MAWRPLPLSASAGTQLPDLLISEAFTPSSYTIQLTDLTHIWSESLDRRAIVRRSRETETSIDPNNGTDQLQIFLDKLRLGLAGGKDTALALTIVAGPDRPSLVLNIDVKLPGGLAPLKWPVQLGAAPQSLMTSHFTVPLLRAQHASAQEFASLTEVVKEKDHVIQKLLDKLEGQGTELGQIFPQAAGRLGRKVDRKMAEERVKGLGPFALDTWRRNSHHEPSRDIAGLIGAVFAGDNAVSLGVDGNTPASEEESDTWWESIKGITVNLATGKISTKGPSSTRKTPPRPKPALRKEETIEDDDAFQIQATPPHLAQSPKRAPSKLVINDSTDDEDDDLDVPTQRSKIPDSFPASPPPAVPSPNKSKKLGSIGAKKATPDPPSRESTVDEASSLHRPSADKSTASPTPPPSETVIRPRKKLGRIGGNKEPLPPEPEPEREVSLPPAKKTPAAEASKPKKGKLGQIGGKKRRPESPPPADEEQPQPEVSKTAATPKRKLGAIGHRHQSAATKKEDTPPQAEENRGRASVKPEKERTPPPRETSEERADKKRQQLKRELEEKAKAPARKKKKF
ncbi:XLF-domain-containing protein [Stipitochalara longipes BDJ]|nr:XLF-domain-containing protein [Stipitochalara longipes BDJ]